MRLLLVEEVTGERQIVLAPEAAQAVFSQFKDAYRSINALHVHANQQRCFVGVGNGREIELQWSVVAHIGD